MHRRTLKAAVVAAFAVFGAVMAAEAAPRDTLVIGIQQEPTSMDPTSDATASIDTILTRNVFETLTTADETGTVQPLLAKSWEVSPDGKVYTFRLNEGVTFTDGKPLDASTVKFAFERAMAPDSTNPSKTIFALITGIETPDATTVVIRLKEPDAYFLANLAMGDAAIVHPDTAANNKTTPVGSGPYKVKEWVRGDRVVLERNDANRLAVKAKLREVSFRVIPDPNTAAAALFSGDINAFPVIPAPETLEQFKQDKRFVVVSGTTEGEVILAMNNAKPPFNDIRVRRAINHLLDRQEIIDGAMSGYGTPIGSHFPPHNPAYVDLTGRYPHDVAKAKELLAEAGFPNGFETTLQLPPPPYARRSGEIIREQLAAGGIRVQLANVEFPFWLSEVYKKKLYDMTIIAHVSPRDLSNYIKGTEYFYGYDSPEFRAMYDDFRKTVDPQQQIEKLKGLQTKLADDAVHGFLFQLAQAGVYDAKLRGYWKNAPELITPLTDMYWAD